MNRNDPFRVDEDRRCRYEALPSVSRSLSGSSTRFNDDFVPLGMDAADGLDIQGLVARKMVVRLMGMELTTLGSEDLCSIRGAASAAPGSYYAKSRLQVNARAVNIASRIGSRDLWLLPPVPETRR